MLTLFLLLALLPAVLRADGIETFLWDKANAAMARALACSISVPKQP